MNTPIMIVSPSIILLQPHVGRFNASDHEIHSILCKLSDKFGHQVAPQRCRLTAYCWLGMLYMHWRVVNTCSTCTGQSISLLNHMLTGFFPHNALLAMHHMQATNYFSLTPIPDVEAGKISFHAFKDLMDKHPNQLQQWNIKKYLH